MDFNSAPTPWLPSSWDEFLDLATFGKGPRWLGQVAGNWSLFAAGSAFISRGSLLAYSFKYRPNSTLAKLSLPFSVGVEQPGVLHLVLDVAWYKGTGFALEVIQDAYKKLEEWFASVDEATIRQYVGAADFAKLTNGGTLTTLTALVEIPPVWLADP